LRSNTIELIKYRNVTAHKSRVTIGEYEALRAVYCCVTLVLWFNKIKKGINWANSKEDILSGVINSSTGQ
jgi:hypothetical protein